MNDDMNSPVTHNPSDLLALVHKWRASANGNIRRGRGYKAKDRHKAIQAIAMAGGLRICAADLEAALGPHICARCGGRFTSKAKCWYHMDFECPKRKLIP